MRSRMPFAALAGWALASVLLAQEPPGTEPPFHLPEPLGLGMGVEPYVYAAWNISIAPDGEGLPPGEGTPARGEELFRELCAGCHTVGDENAHGFPVLAGGQGSLTSDDPLLTVGSYWPFATTLYDYIHRAMPFPAPQSLEPDEVYSLAAFLLWRNGILEDEDQRLGPDNLASFNERMPNHEGFTYPDPRPDTRNVACMRDCPPLEAPKVSAEPGAGRREAPHGGHHTFRAPSARGYPVEPVEPVDLPFDVALVPIELDPMIENHRREGLHSAASAVVEAGPHAGAWLIVGGRTDGLHKTGDRYDEEPDPSFPEDRDNDRFWAVDPTSGAVAWVPATGLPGLLYDALTSTNQQSVQDGEILWIAGGYGWNTELENYGTFGLLIAIDVPRLVAAIFARPGEELADPAGYFSWGTAPEGCAFFDENGCREPEGAHDFDLTVTGGGMEWMDGHLVLALGQRFGGEYNDTGAHHFAQVYTCRVLRLEPPEPRWGDRFELGKAEMLAHGGANCGPGESGNADDPFHRRDLNVVPLLFPDCTRDLGPECRGAMEAVGIYGGVFTANFSGHAAPILIHSRGETVGAEVQGGDAQVLSQYEAPRISFFDAERGSVHTLILGGMGVHYCTGGEEPGEGATRQCTAIREVQPPSFTGDGTILSWSRDGEFSQAFLYRPYPVEGELLGSNGLFLPAPGVPRAPNGVIELHRLPRDRSTTVGHVFGGIAVEGPAPRHVFFSDGPSWASHRAFEVKIRPRP